MSTTIICKSTTSDSIVVADFSIVPTDFAEELVSRQVSVHDWADIETVGAYADGEDADGVLHIWKSRKITSFGVLEAYASNGCDVAIKYHVATSHKDAKRIFGNRFYNCTDYHPYNYEMEKYGDVTIVKSMSSLHYLALITPNTTTLPGFEFKLQ